MRIRHYDRPGVKRELREAVREARREAREKRAEELRLFLDHTQGEEGDCPFVADDNTVDDSRGWLSVPGAREFQDEFVEPDPCPRTESLDLADFDFYADDLAVYYPESHWEGPYWRNAIEELEEMAPENVDDPSILELCFLDALLVRKNARELGLDVRIVDAYVFRVIKRGIEIGFSPVDKFHPAIK